MIEQATPKALHSARELLAANRPREAAALVSAFLQEHPRNEEAWHILSFALTDPDKQAYALRRVLQINPRNRAARSQLARLQAPAPAAAPRVAPVAPPAPAEARPRASAAPRRALPRAERSPSTFARVARYLVVRATVLFATVVVGIFLATILINYGGFVDQIFEANINDALMGMARGMRDVPPEDIPAILEQARLSMREAYGLNDPFLLRCLRWTVQGITLNWGDVERLMLMGLRDVSVRGIILDRLPNSLMLLAAGNLVVFVVSLLLALALSKRYGRLVDRLIIGLSPLSAAPTWVHGILLTVIFAVHLNLLPFGGMFDETPPEQPIGYALVVAKHMILPVAAIFMATFFSSVYAWRTFFVLHSQEDYVEMAEAKGLPAQMLERRYILRPALPYIITSFALVLITSWQGLLVLEVFFHWPGIGALFIEAVNRIDRPMLVALIVMFAYLLAITVLLLDLVYALVDPRVKLGGRNGAAGPRTGRHRLRRRGRGAPLLSPNRGPRQAGGRGRSQGLAWRREAGASWQAWKAAPGDLARGLGRFSRGLGAVLRDVARYPSAILGLLLILALVAMSVYAIVAVPLDEAIRQSRGAREDWYAAPGYAQPAWVNLFRKDDLPPTVLMDSAEGDVPKTVEVVSEDMTRTTISFAFDYAYGALPNDILVFVRTSTGEKRPYAIYTMSTPDGRQIEIANYGLGGSAETYYLSADKRFARRAGTQRPLEALFLPPGATSGPPVQGRYVFQVEGLTFEEGAEFDARLVVEGQVYGPAGTDHMGRDLALPLLWGTPIALTFGLFGAVGTAVVSLIIAAVGTWFGGWVDELVQRLTEINMILPALPIAIMVYLAYSKSVWVILGVMVLLNVFGSAIKNYRAIILQVKESPYIEAARVYGASNRRIILRYLVPRILPVLVPHLVTLIPGYVFLEATLAYLGVVDPVLPTWGKVINDALRNGAFQGHYYWVLEPIGLLLATGLAFALLGFALDRILNPKLRSL